MELTAFEKDVVALLLNNECPQASSDINLLTVKMRENTGVGAYITFDYNCDVLHQTPRPHHIGSSIAIKIAGLSGGAGCVLFFKNDRIELLELFSYGSAWPEEITDYTLTTIR